MRLVRIMLETSSLTISVRCLRATILRADVAFLPQSIEGYIMNFVILSSDEKAEVGTVINNDIATVKHATVHPKLAPATTKRRIQFTWHFDFTDVTRAELMEIASRSLVITMRAPFKTLDEPRPEDWNDKTFNVREWLDTERRQPADKVANAKKAFDKLSDEQKQAILAELLK